MIGAINTDNSLARCALAVPTGSRPSVGHVRAVVVRRSAESAPQHMARTAQLFANAMLGSKYSQPPRP